MSSILKTAYEVYHHQRIGGIRTNADLRAAATAWRQRHMQAGDVQYAPPLREDRDPMIAYVNHGRWLIDCPCGNGVPITPRNDPRPEAVCFACGWIWTNVVFPIDVDSIEAALSVRSWLPNQNWRPSENVEDLIAENATRRKGASN